MPSGSAQARKPIVHVAMLGARLHYAVPRLLEELGLLGTFYTDVYLGNKPLLRAFLARIPQALKPAAVRRLQGRVCDELADARVVSFDGLGVREFQIRRAKSASNLNAIFARTNRDFCKRVLKSGLEGGSAIYGLNGASLEIFQQARRLGMACILEQTFAPRRAEKRLMAEEAERWSGWEPRLKPEPEADPLADREQAEWALADKIVCGSGFVAENLRALGADDAKCQIVPYGIDVSRFLPKKNVNHGNGINLLFVGEVGLRKGVPYLLEALRLLNSKRIRCRFVGLSPLHPGRLSEYGRWAEFLGSVPRINMLEMYHWADVFVFPSICEGSALVNYEAMACGLPVITTQNSGSIVRDGKDGFVVPIRDSQALAERVEELLLDRDRLSAMSRSALDRIESFTLEKYGQQLESLIRDLCDR
jgi:glycosyltransferase involved in cell wall biosynthesis